jgi:hypothetical protein
LYQNPFLFTTLPSSFIGRRDETPLRRHCWQSISITQTAVE